MFPAADITPARRSVFAGGTHRSGRQIDVRDEAGLLARRARFSDATLPADLETVAILAPDDKGERVPHEAVPPGTKAVLLVEGAPEQREE